jgi:hypothetical protein
MTQYKASDVLLGRKVRTIYPDLARELEREPKLTDISLIPQIIKTHYRPSDDRFIFLGAILNLYDPDVLDGWKRNLCKGIRPKMAELFGVTHTAISNNVATIQNYMLIYKKFKDSVEQLSDEIEETYKPKN